MGDLISRGALLKSIDIAPDEWAKGRTIERYIRNAPAVDAVEVVRCKDCIHRGNECNCPMCWTEWYDDPDDGYDMVFRDNTTDDGFCYCGAKNDAEG